VEGGTVRSADGTGGLRHAAQRHIVLVIVLGAVVVVALVALVRVLAGPDGFSLVDSATGDWAYLATFALIFGDAIFPLLPGETTLNAASTLASAGSLQLGLVMLAGALGAILGDSTLYWAARSARGRFEHQIEVAKRNARLAAALDFLGSSAPLLLVAGRYLPGARFVINSTMGISAFPYRRFIVWSAIGGTLWSVYTCGLAYLVATALAGFPLASVVISGVITTSAIAAIYVVVRRRGKAASTDEARGVTATGR
jgi:membrane-associated protein